MLLVLPTSLSSSAMNCWLLVAGMWWAGANLSDAVDRTDITEADRSGWSDAADEHTDN